MILTGGIHIVPQDDRQPVDLRFALAEADVVILQKFLVEVDYLNKSIASIGGFNASLSLSCSVPNKVSFENTEPNEDQRAIILHRLRPIILKKEPHSFDAICAIIHSSTQSDFMSNHLRAIRKIYLGKELLQTFQLSHGEMVLNSESGFWAWLNSFEYHRESEKADLIVSPDGPFSIDHFRPIFILVASEKIRAISLLAQIATCMLDSPVQRSESP